MHTVYVEANFVLRVALQQEQSQECECLIEAAESNALVLAASPLAVFESLYKLRRRRQEQAGQAKQLKQLYEELQRNKFTLHKEAVSYIRETCVQIAQLSNHERQELASTIERLCQCMYMLPMGPAMFQEAYSYEESVGASMQSADALILSTILTHARERAGERFFLTSDRDFSSSATIRQLTKDAGLQLFHEPQVLLTRLRTRGVLKV